MRTHALSTLIFGSAVTVLLSGAPASAQATRTWVSGVGDDVNPCSRTAPCKTFAGAISKTFINGEINCLDPAGYGTVTITKSITIDCRWTHGSILASGTTGVIINIAAGNVNDPTRSVRLRGLSINGTGASGAVGTRTGLDGVRILAASSVFIEETVIAEFSQQGVDASSLAAATNITLDDVTIKNTNVSGIAMSTSAGQVVASFNRLRIDGTPLAISGVNNVRGNMRNVNIAHATNGIQTSGSDSIFNADNLMVSFASVALQSNGGSAIRISNSMITQNATGLNPNGGAIVSLAGNTVTGNTVDGAFSATVPKL